MSRPGFGVPTGNVGAAAGSTPHGPLGDPGLSWGAQGAQPCQGPLGAAAPPPSTPGRHAGRDAAEPTASAMGSEAQGQRQAGPGDTGGLSSRFPEGVKCGLDGRRGHSPQAWLPWGHPGAPRSWASGVQSPGLDPPPCPEPHPRGEHGASPRHTTTKILGWAALPTQAHARHESRVRPAGTAPMPLGPLLSVCGPLRGRELRTAPRGPQAGRASQGPGPPTHAPQLPQGAPPPLGLMGTPGRPRGQPPMIPTTSSSSAQSWPPLPGRGSLGARGTPFWGVSVAVGRGSLGGSSGLQGGPASGWSEASGAQARAEPQERCRLAWPRRPAGWLWCVHPLTSQPTASQAVPELSGTPGGGLRGVPCGATLGCSGGRGGGVGTPKTCIWSGLPRGPEGASGGAASAGLRDAAVSWGEAGRPSPWPCPWTWGHCFHGDTARVSPRRAPGSCPAPLAVHLSLDPGCCLGTPECPPPAGPGGSSDRVWAGCLVAPGPPSTVEPLSVPCPQPPSPTTTPSLRQASLRNRPAGRPLGPGGREAPRGL